MPRLRFADRHDDVQESRIALHDHRIERIGGIETDADLFDRADLQRIVEELRVERHVDRVAGILDVDHVAAFADLGAGRTQRELQTYLYH